MDYEQLGLKAGLEIHQQLDTGKLFCNCPSYLRSEKPDFSVKRKLHPVAGETGEIDAAVAYEAALDKEFVYEGYNDTTCLIELDEEPPKMINSEALKEALKIALLFNCEIYQTAQIMRKTVIDGSNTSGFQRTVLIGHDGFIETSFGRVGVETVALEEDSARPSTGGEDDAENGNIKRYKLDRLGIPLVEVTTKPDMSRPEQIKEAALKIGEILRACRVKRGIGTIRQDLNVSTKGHERVEIKGFQEPGMMVKTVEMEIERQQNELKLGKNEKSVRGALADGSTKFQRPMPGRARMYPETDLPLLKTKLDIINEVKRGLPKLKHEMREELKKKGLSNELIELVLDGNVDEFEVLMRVYNKDANLVAKMVTLWRNEFATKFKKKVEEAKQVLSEGVLERVLEAVSERKIDEGDVKPVLLKIFEGKPVEEALMVEKIGGDGLEEGIAKIVKEKPGLRAGAYMGLIIQKLGANVDKRKAMEILGRLVK